MSEPRLDRIEIATLKEFFETSPIFSPLFKYVDNSTAGQYSPDGMWVYQDADVAKCFVAFCEGAITGALFMLGATDRTEIEELQANTRMAVQCQESSEDVQFDIDLSKF